MSDIVIKAENISKAYQIGEFSTGTLSNDIERWWKLIRGKEDPYLKIGETNDKSTKSKSNIVWSLKDINFEIQKGDAVGIIGKNGAGKSTLLKLLSRVTSPTSGSIKLKGKIASLLEVGTGFHPELTGRENIYLNGAILGMRRSEITRKFDEIADFSGVERYIDTPVKRYSSGMYVRLAFAVAAYLESEILIVDEVLAVGDAEFQKKCIGKMEDVSLNEGRTVLFVSHNIQAIESLCKKTILLENGILSHYGNTRDVVFNYSQIKNYNTNLQKHSSDFEYILFSKVEIKNKNGNILIEKESLDVEIHFKIKKEVTNIHISIMLKNKHEDLVGCKSTSNLKNLTLKKGNYKISAHIDLSLKHGFYNLNIGCGSNRGTLAFIQDVNIIKIIPSEINYEESSGSLFITNSNWQIANND